MAEEKKQARKVLVAGRKKGEADISARTGVRQRFLPAQLKQRTPTGSQKLVTVNDGAAAPAPAPKRRRTSAAGDVGRAAAGVTTVARTQKKAAFAAVAHPQEGVRLSRIMAQRGLCSRREADGLIERGWVRVDGKVVDVLGSRIAPEARVELDPRALRALDEQVTILLHKPLGYVSGQAEDGYLPAVTLVEAKNQFANAGGDTMRFRPQHLRGLAPAGRLDIDSTGLLVLTANGRIARQLIGEHSNVEKEYQVRIEGVLDDRGLALLNHGLMLDGRKLRCAQVERLSEHKLRFILREGRKRQVRRMCELVGVRVSALKRVRIGQVKLADLPLGQWRYLRADEAF